MILVTGIDGQLGYEVISILDRENIPFLGIGIKDLNFTSLDNVRLFLEEKNFDIIINCAAYTNVNEAEKNDSLVDLINHQASNVFASYCQKHNAKYVIISTDYVFDGEKEGVYEVNDMKHPLNVYGKSKDLAENDAIKINKNTFVVRTSWVFGLNGNNFIRKMINLSKNHNEISVVSDQIGSPTYAKDLACFLVNLVQTDKYGIYHVTNEDYCSWYQFANDIFSFLNINIKISAVSSSFFKNDAKRPLNSKLSKKSIISNGFSLLPSYKDALNRYLNELKENNLLWKE